MGEHARHVLVFLAAGSMLTGTVTASATTLGGVGTPRVGSGSADVAECDLDGLTVTYATEAGAVTGATLGGIADPACEGGRVTLVLRDALGAAIGSGGPVTVASDADGNDNSVAIPVSPQPGAPSVSAFAAQIVGP